MRLGYILFVCGQVLWAPDGDLIPGGGPFSSRMCVCAVSRVLFGNSPSLDLISGTKVTSALFTPSFGHSLAASESANDVCLIN